MLGDPDCDLDVNSGYSNLSRTDFQALRTSIPSFVCMHTLRVGRESEYLSNASNGRSVDFYLFRDLISEERSLSAIYFLVSARARE